MSNTEIITSSTLPISHKSDIVGETVVDKLNAKVDIIFDAFLSPYLGKEDVVDLFEPQYAYLPPPQEPNFDIQH